MLIGEIIQRIISIYNKGAKSDDSRLTPRHVYNKMLTVRNRLIEEEIKKKQKVNQWNYQYLPCIELIKARPNECPCIPPVGCEILRSKHKIPKPLTGYDSHMIDSVTDINGTIRFDETSWKDKRLKNFNKYTANKPDYFLYNGYLYITHKIKIRVVTLMGLFEDPMEAEKFPSFCNEDCKDCEDCRSMFEIEFPMDSDMIETFVEMAAVELIDRFNQNIEDSTNNSKDNLPEQTK